MAFSPPPSDRSGYATPAALVFSLALALVAAAAVQRSAAQVRLARADLARREVDYGLSGAHLMAAAAVVRSGVEGPYHWIFGADVGMVDAVAELEADKLSLEAAGKLDDAVFGPFGVRDPEALRGRLTAAGRGQAEGGRFVDVRSLDPAPLWRRCAPSMVSGFGLQDSFVYEARSEPGPGPKPVAWRIGETWRISLTTATGWRDDRIVRFTGDALHPIAVVSRRMARDEGEVGQCEKLYAAVPAA